MAPTTIDLLHDEIRKMHSTNPVRAYELSEQLIEASIAAGYLKHVPRARIYCANYILRTTEQHDEVPLELNRAVTLARDLGQNEDEAEGLVSLGHLNRTLGNLPEARGHFEQALVIATECGYWRGVAHATHGIAEVLQDQGLNELAIDQMRRACDLTRGTDLESGPLGGLAELFAESGDYRTALNLEMRALELRRKQGQPLLESFALGFIAKMHIKLGEYGLAKECYLEAYRIANEHNDAGRIAFSLYVAGECEILVGEFSSAEEKLQRAVSILSERWATDCHLALAGLALRREVPMVALEEIESVEGAYANAGVRSHLEDVHKLYAEAYEQLGDWKQVAYHEKERRRVNDEMNSMKFKAQLNETHIMLGTERERKETEMQKIRAERSESELANTTLHLLAQTELLSDLRRDLLAIARKISPQDAIAKEIRERVKTLPLSTVDWERFDAQFKSAHPEFAKKLIEKYPKLTHSEIRMCSLLRMNLRSAEIARLFCLSERTVEDHRTNIRRKMKLPRAEDLIATLTKM
jgi:tetratricopeptide (TPR) repeat protein